MSRNDLWECWDTESRKYATGKAHGAMGVSAGRFPPWPPPQPVGEAARPSPTAFPEEKTRVVPFPVKGKLVSPSRSVHSKVLSLILFVGGQDTTPCTHTSVYFLNSITS